MSSEDTLSDKLPDGRDVTVVPSVLGNINYGPRYEGATDKELTSSGMDSNKEMTWDREEGEEMSKGTSRDNGDKLTLGNNDVGRDILLDTDLHDLATVLTPVRTSSTTTTLQTGKAGTSATNNFTNTGGGAINDSPVYRTGVSTSTPVSTKAKCHYTSEGMCLLHNRQATENFKPGWVTEIGPGGVKTKTYTRKTFWLCENHPTTGIALKQTRLTFKKSASTRGGGDTRGGTQYNSFSTHTEGQLNNMGTARK